MKRKKSARSTFYNDDIQLQDETFEILRCMILSFKGSLPFDRHRFLTSELGV